MDLNPAPFRGDAGIPHVSEDFFKMCFIGSNVSVMAACRGVWILPLLSVSLRKLTWLTSHRAVQLALAFLSLPGRVLGSEIRPRKFK